MGIYILMNIYIYIYIYIFIYIPIGLLGVALTSEHIFLNLSLLAPPNQLGLMFSIYIIISRAPVLYIIHAVVPVSVYCLL